MRHSDWVLNVRTSVRGSTKTGEAPQSSIFCFPLTALATKKLNRSNHVNRAARTAKSPEGTAEISPGRQSWVNATTTEPVPLGTAEHGCPGFQPSLTGLLGTIFDFPGRSSWAALNRPCMTHPNSTGVSVKKLNRAQTLGLVSGHDFSRAAQPESSHSPERQTQCQPKP
jgi:hypothetical protein